MRVIWAPSARRDLERIDDFLLERDPDFARKSARAAVAAGQFLSENPRAGSPVARTRRKWLVRGAPYLLIYRVTEGTVEILRVRHERENWRSPA